MQAAEERGHRRPSRWRRARAVYRNVSKRKVGWLLLKDTVNSCMEYRVTGLAAEAAFFVLLSLPPLLLGLVGALGYVDTVVGLDTIDHIRHNILTASATVLSDKGVNQLVKPLVDDVFHGRRPDLISLGFLIALWSGSRAVNVFVDTITIMYGLEGRRGIVKTRLMSLVLYVVALILGAAVLPLVVAGPDAVVDVLPGGQGAIQVLYWPVVLFSSIAFLTTLYHVSVPVRSPWYEDVPGALVALLMWVVGSFVLRIYLTHAVEGPTIYGSLAAPVAVLLWIGVSAFAVLVGAAVNAAVDRVWPSLATAAAREENARRREAAAAEVVAQAAARRARHAKDDDGADEDDPPSEYPERWAEFLPHRDVRARLRGLRRPAAGQPITPVVPPTRPPSQPAPPRPVAPPAVPPLPPPVRPPHRPSDLDGGF
ncbi:membrane protein [Actinacidiphila alni]|uniref:Membrane protein n=1 Tax=Actinacidiphila alni TaxID=380248 RepID=A0A1I2E3V8_9ACTN|nr:YihY/virulence factor BrkB family protein [Actinacidiphila alni]SFE87349.1 membrane protein [Actinacidiphila alni]